MVRYDEMIDRMKSLAQCLSRASEDGYLESFKMAGDNLSTDDGKYLYDPQQVTLIHLYSFEGISNRGDDSVVYLLETDDGKRGTLIDAFGPYSNTKLAGFMRKVDTLKRHAQAQERRSWKEFLRGY